jgi:hypothetical protein
MASSQGGDGGPAGAVIQPNGRRARMIRAGVRQVQQLWRDQPQRNIVAMQDGATGKLA